MRIVENHQIWKGFFSYLQGYELIDSYKKVSFEMNLTFNGDSFTGTRIDSETENIIKEPILVKGFVDDGKISFVVNYPYEHYRDDNGGISIDRTSKHPPIQYLGFYDEDEKKFSGTWEMLVYEEKISEDEYLEEVANGEFEVYREK